MMVSLVVLVATQGRAQQLTVAAWGNDSYGETTVPVNVTNATLVVASSGHSLALLENGTLQGWGANGDPPPPGLSEIRSVSKRTFHGLALLSNGTVIAWGHNQFGGATVPTGLNNVIGVAAGDHHSLALKSDGTVVGWGGQGSDGVVPTGLSLVRAISAGLAHSLALLSNGTVVAWGWNNNGQATVPPGLANVVAISAGGYHSMALRNDGAVVVWGGQDASVQPPPGLANIISVSAGTWHNLAIKSDGSVAAWGDNSRGQLNAPAGLRDVVAIAAGHLHSLALTRAELLAVVSQPQDLTRYRGEDAAFSVSAKGLAPLTYQWLKNDTLLTGATSTTLQLHSVRSSDAARYRVLITDGNGATLSSMPSVLTVVDPRVLVATLNPSADTSIHSSGSNPRGAATILSGTRRNAITDRGLLRFDVSSLPAGAIIQSARVRFQMIRVPAFPAPSTFSLHRMFTLWDATATWAQARVGVPWASLGGMSGSDYSADASAQCHVGPGPYDFVLSTRGISDLEAWRSNSPTNAGWLLKTDSEGTPGTARHFGSSESASPPQLLIEYLTAFPVTRLRNVHLEDSQFRFSFDSAPGWIYRVEYSDYIDAGPWTVITNAATSGSTALITIAAPISASRRFYRVVVE
jgi:hypothetical protein